MTDVIIRATAIRWESHDFFPGWLEVSVVDARGDDHRIVEKVPVLTTSRITPATPMPTELWIAADMEHIDGEQVGVTLKSGVETVGGQRSLTVSSADVRWL